VRFIGITPVRTTLSGAVFVTHAEIKDITHESVVKSEVLVTSGRVNLKQSQLPRRFTSISRNKMFSSESCFSYFCLL